MDLAERLWYNCCQDLFPDEAAEAIYGFKMGNELGTIVIGFWSFLIKGIIARVSTPTRRALITCLGPSLIIFNDGAFTESDYRSILKVGNSRKGKSTEDTGRFGQGFNSCYHITDIPSLYSNDMWLKL